MYCANFPPYNNWFLKKQNPALEQDITGQQIPIMFRYCAAQGTVGTPTLWGWPAQVGRKKVMLAFGYLDKNGNFIQNWQMLAAGGP